MINLKKIVVSGWNVPDYFINWVNDNSGITVQNRSIESFIENPPSIFLTTGSEIRHNMETVFELMDKCKIKSVVIISGHIYKFTDEKLKKINELAKDKNVTILSMGSSLNGYENIKSYQFDLIEHVISNDLNFLLSCELKNNRNPKKDFTFFVNMKDDFRKIVYDGLKDTGVFENSLIFASEKEQMKTLSDNQELIFKKINEIYTNNNMLNALKSWNALPNFKVYEEIFCEIVIESRNDGALADLSEKTYRPIALNIPFVFLGHGLMYQKLLKDGYTLVDNSSFYKEWHKNVPLPERMPALINFLQQIRVDQNLRKQMELMAQHNYENFWTKRKFTFFKNNYTIFTNCFGENLIQKIYKNLNF